MEVSQIHRSHTPPTTLRTQSILKTLNTPPGRMCAILREYRTLYSTGHALNAILNYWVEELRMNYIALAIALG